MAKRLPARSGPIAHVCASGDSGAFSIVSSHPRSSPSSASRARNAATSSKWPIFGYRVSSSTGDLSGVLTAETQRRTEEDEEGEEGEEGEPGYRTSHSSS